MDKSKNILTKSKSNGQTTAAKHRGRRNGKQSRSTAAIKGDGQEHDEAKKSTNKTNTQPRRKCGPRPGRKRFLTSALNLLAKTTSGIPHASGNDNNITTPFAMNNDKLNENELVEDLIISKRKPKFKRSLDDFQNDIDEVYSYKKDITPIASNFSVDSYQEPEDIKWSEFLPRLVPQTESDIEYEQTIKALRDSDSTRQSRVEVNTENKNLYNIFAKLHDTITNKLNDNTEFDAAKLTRKISPKTNVGNETGTNKINTEIAADTSQRKKLCSKYTQHKRVDKIVETDSSSVATSRNTTTKKIKAKLNSSSFVYKNKNENFTTRSFVSQKPTNKRLKKGKNNFLNLLKKQLRIENSKFIEPQNFFQALKVMARNKRQEKKIKFIVPLEKRNDSNFHKIFKERLPSTASKLNRKLNIHNNTNKTTSLNSQSWSTGNTRKKLPDILENKAESRHSLQVYAFDFETGFKETKVAAYPMSPSVILKSSLSTEETLYLSDASSDFQTVL